MAEQSFEQFVERLLLVLKDRRKELGLTQGDLGERLGKPQSAIARLESGTIKDPHISMVFDFCEALDSDIAEIIQRSGVKSVGKKSSLDSSVEERVRQLIEKTKTMDKSKRDAFYEIVNGLEKLV